MESGFSIVICTYNGESRLKTTFEHVAVLQIPLGLAVELILVNNASTDSTGMVARRIWNELGNPFPLVLLDESRPGKGYAVETGYDAARYEYILTADDDNWLRADYLNNALKLFEQDGSIGVLQGHSTAAFESVPPPWFHALQHYFVIGGPTNAIGHFPKNNFFVWGAGMVIQKADWLYLRGIGYSALTSKLPGKAAGEDNELAIALLILGRKIYYSDTLSYQHFMPINRLEWPKLKQNFETFGYVSHYFFLYGLVLDAHKNDYVLTDFIIKKRFLRYWLRIMKELTFKQHVAYWVLPKEEYYQLMLTHYHSHFKWFFQLRKNALVDIRFIQNWLLPIYKENPENFSWPVKI